MRMRYDYKKCYEKNAAFWRRRAWGAGFLAWASRALTLLFAAAYVCLTAVVFFRFAKLRALGVLVAFAACVLGVQACRRVWSRPRPFEAAGAAIVPLVEKKKAGRSFPSRHASCAFCIATVFLPFAVWAAIPLYLLACALAYARFALGWHYPSDLIGGGVWGALCCLLVFLF